MGNVEQSGVRSARLRRIDDMYECEGLREEFGDAIVFTSGGEETARLIAYYLEHPEERRRVGEVGRRIVKDRYVHSRWARAVHEFYDRVVSEKRRKERSRESISESGASKPDPESSEVGE